jgi:hypothetical protein
MRYNVEEGNPRQVLEPNRNPHTLVGAINNDVISGVAHHFK